MSSRLLMSVLSSRSPQQLSVADAGPVGRLEQAAAAAPAPPPPAPRGDQPEAAGKEQRKDALSFRQAVFPPTSHVCLAMQSVWVRKGTLRWWRDWRPQRWVDVGVALEQSTGSDGRRDSIFFVYYTQFDEKKVSSRLR